MMMVVFCPRSGAGNGLFFCGALLEEVNSGWSELGHMRPRGDINSKKEKRNMYRVSFSDSVLLSFSSLCDKCLFGRADHWKGPSTVHRPSCPQRTLFPNRSQLKHRAGFALEPCGVSSPPDPKVSAAIKERREKGEGNLGTGIGL